MTVAIVGIGTWLPEVVRTNDAWPPRFAERAHRDGDRTFNDIPPSEDLEAAAIVARDLAAEKDDPFLGARVRRVADAATTAAEAEAHAGLAALRDAGVAPEDVDLVLSNSVVPDRIGPATACAVSHRVGATRAVALSMDAGCASA